MVKEKLYEYPVIKAEINRLEIEKRIIASEYTGISGHNEEIRPGSSTNKVTSPVEGEVFSKESRIRKIDNMIAAKNVEIEIIDNALSILSVEDKRLVELKYFKKYKVDVIAEMMYCSSITIARRTKDILSKLKPLIVI